ncbi:CRISPR-associated endonuclease Cas6 [Methanonatronarchaeum sp. AMET-Sl]|uniref:CRISPR-associated endonuclease Cas6 n=1 Tax=Methanonatronarchaeum sp. AMET-Sl TaxID=3037654 RepID=UPI00244E436F|nr:CRISPR-associated endonuclease Cas6 [Methanonatronarchaeum sp. AMET-Sl]WGI17157.1 CRISPR-associated endonuclease Cas6 [Methanonatronarchaeum sp. AMET-Sl]
MKKIDTVNLKIETEKKVQETGRELRGFIAKKFNKDILTHHHTENGLVYSYPKIQYAVLEGVPTITGIEEGVNRVKDMAGSIQALTLSDNVYKVKGWSLRAGSHEFGVTREQQYYKFITPWLALNNQNYEKYKSTSDWKEKKELLNNILTGNILSMAKGLNKVIEKKIYVHTHLYEKTTRYKGIDMVGFTGKFKTNFKIPNKTGLGKGVSRGYGKIKKRNPKNN